MYFAVTCHNYYSAYISKCSTVNEFHYVFPQPLPSSCVDHHTIINTEYFDCNVVSLSHNLLGKLLLFEVLFNTGIPNTI